MSPTPTGPVFFVDRCLGRHVAKMLQQHGLTVKYLDDYFPQAVEDTDWIPIVGERGWIVLTKDVNISRNHIERMAVTQAKLYFFALVSKNLNGDAMAEALVNASIKIQSIVRKHPSPLIARVYRDGSVKIWRDCDALNQEI